MNIREKTALFIFSEVSGKMLKAISKADIRDEYKDTLRDLSYDGYLDARTTIDENGGKTITGYDLTDRGKMRYRMLLEKWEEEQ